MDCFKISCYPHPSEELYARVWINDKVYNCESFDEMVELFVRIVCLNLSAAKDFSQKIAVVGGNTLVNLGKF